MTARLEFPSCNAERERRAAEYWLTRLYMHADLFFPEMSAPMKARWVQAKLYIGNARPKVKIGVALYGA